MNDQKIPIYPSLKTWHAFWLLSLPMVGSCEGRCDNDKMKGGKPGIFAKAASASGSAKKDEQQTTSQAAKNGAVTNQAAEIGAKSPVVSPLVKKARELNDAFEKAKTTFVHAYFYLPQSNDSQAEKKPRTNDYWKSQQALDQVLKEIETPYKATEAAYHQLVRHYNEHFGNFNTDPEKNPDCKVVHTLKTEADEAFEKKVNVYYQAVKSGKEGKLNAEQLAQQQQQYQAEQAAHQSVKKEKEKAEAKSEVYAKLNEWVQNVQFKSAIAGHKADLTKARDCMGAGAGAGLRATVAGAGTAVDIAKVFDVGAGSVQGTDFTGACTVDGVGEADAVKTAIDAAGKHGVPDTDLQAMVEHVLEGMYQKLAGLAGDAVEADFAKASLDLNTCKAFLEAQTAAKCPSAGQLLMCKMARKVDNSVNNAGSIDVGQRGEVLGKIAGKIDPNKVAQSVGEILAILRANPLDARGQGAHDDAAKAKDKVAALFAIGAALQLAEEAQQQGALAAALALVEDPATALNALKAAADGASAGDLGGAMPGAVKAILNAAAAAATDLKKLFCYAALRMAAGQHDNEDQANNLRVKAHDDAELNDVVNAAK